MIHITKSFQKHLLTVLFISTLFWSYAQSANFKLSEYISVGFPVKPVANNDNDLYSFIHQSENGLMSAIVAPANTNSSKNMLEMYRGALDGLKKKALSLEYKKATRNNCIIYTANYKATTPEGTIVDCETILLYFRNALFFVTYSAYDPRDPITQAEKEQFLSSLTINNQNGTISQIDGETEDSLTSNSSYNKGYAIGKLVGVLLIVVIGGVLLYSFRSRLF